MRLSLEQKLALHEYSAIVKMCEANSERRRSLKKSLRRAENEQIELVELMDKAQKKFFDSIGFKPE